MRYLGGRYWVLLGMLALALFASSGQPQDEKKKDPFDQAVKHLKYRSIGPAAGGRTTRSSGIPGDPTTYYVGAASGGVWKTTDAGISWKPIFDDQPTSSIGALAVAPSDPNVVYVGSGEANIRGNVAPGNGIYVSTNGGKSWKHVWKQKGQIGHIVVHPKNASIAYAAVLGSAFGPNPERGIYRTVDGGKTWTQSLKKNGDVGAIDVCIDPNNPRILFAALVETRRTPWSLTTAGPGSGLFRSEDGGDSWKEIEPGDDSGLPAKPYGRIGVAVAPSDSRRVYALIEAENGGLYRSDDGGEKWTLVNAARYLRQRPWYFSTVHVDPKNPDIVYCPNVRLAKSSDGGKSFKQMKGVHHPDHHDLWIDPKNPRRMIDSNDGGVDITTNGGETWHAPPLPIAQFYHISVDNNVPYRVMGNMQDQGTASGPSNSLSSAGISLSDWHNIGGGETGYSVADPGDPNIVYSGEYAGILTRYDHRTRQARNISIYPTNPSGKGAEDLRYRFQWTAPLMISRTSIGDMGRDVYPLYHAANVLFRSSDKGKSWEKISPDLTRDDKSKQKWSGGPVTGDNTGVEYYGTIFAIAESPSNNLRAPNNYVLWAGSDDGLVHVTRDGGKKWDNVTKNIVGLKEWGTVCCIEASPHDAGTAYVVVDAHRLDDNTPYLYMTKDFGKSWNFLSANLPKEDYLRVVREDPQTPGLLFVGSETQVHLSPDRGVTWHSLKLNMPTVAISDLHVKDNDLVVGTSGRSCWILDDLTPIRQFSPRPSGGEGPGVRGPRFFAVQPATRWRYHGENYAGEDRIPGDNPPKGAILNYYLPTKPKDELTLEIFDGKDTLVQKLSSKKAEVEIDEDSPDVPWSIFKPTMLSKEVGINRVAWNLEMIGPKVIPGAKNDAGVPYRGPLVPPGTYTLKLRVGDQVLTQKVEVRSDPRVKTPTKELEDSHQLALQLRDDITRLSNIVIALQSVRDQIQARVKALSSEPERQRAEAWIKQAKALVAKLDALEVQLHNPKAQVTYDILAMKGGAKLYSQLAPLYDSVKDSDGPVTQGMREVYAEHAKELARLDGIWRKLLDDEVTQLNDQARDLQQPAIVAPK